MCARTSCFSSWNCCLMFFKLMTVLTCCILHSCRPWILEIHAIGCSSEMQRYFSRLLVVCLATVLLRVTVGVCQSQSVHYPSSSHMQHRMPVAHASAQTVGFKCINCKGIVDSRWSVACHRRHRTSKEPHARTPTASNHYRSLDVQISLLEFFANMQEP